MYKHTISNYIKQIYIIILYLWLYNSENDKPLYIFVACCLLMTILYLFLGGKSIKNSKFFSGSFDKSIKVSVDTSWKWTIKFTKINFNL